MSISFLGSEIYSGGEGIIHTSTRSASEVVKVFHDPKYGAGLQDKMRHLQSTSDKYITPDTLFTDHLNRVTAFTMKKLPLGYHSLSLLFYEDSCNKLGITLQDKVHLFREMGQDLSYLHKKGIVVGDLNAENIMFQLKGKERLRYLDTSAYQTPNVPHNGVLQPDICDFLFNAQVSEKSDYFAYAVLLFQALCLCHPYKGILKGMRVGNPLKARMEQKISILSNNPNLIIPTGYRPITSSALMMQFKRIFEDGERFLVSLDGSQPKAVVAKPKPAVYIDDGVLSYVNVYKGTFSDVHVVGDYFTIFKTSAPLTYRCTSSGVVSNIGSFHHIDGENVFSTLEDISMIPLNTMHRLGSHIIGRTHNQTLDIDISASNGGKAGYTDMAIEPLSLRGRYGMFQSFSKASFLLCYNEQVKSIYTCTTHLKVKDFIQFGKYACVEHIVNQKPMYTYIEVSGTAKILGETDRLSWSCCINSMIFEPQDGQIVIKRISDLQVLGHLPSKRITASSKLFSTKAGILVVNKDEVFILNKR